MSRLLSVIELAAGPTVVYIFPLYVSNSWIPRTLYYVYIYTGKSPESHDYEQGHCNQSLKRRYIIIRDETLMNVESCEGWFFICFAGNQAGTSVELTHGFDGGK